MTCNRDLPMTYLQVPTVTDLLKHALAESPYAGSESIDNDSCLLFSE